MGKKVRFLLKMFLILMGSICAGTLALTFVYMLPISLMQQHVTSSIDIFYTESVYPQQVQGYKATQLDNETDAIMLLGAIYQDNELTALQKAMAVPHITMAGENSLCVTLKNFLWDDIEPDGVSYYDRYWHGYLLYLKPLLLLMDYADIRMLNMMIQLGLLLAVVLAMIKRGKALYLPAFCLFLIVQNPVATAMSLQFSSIYYIILLAMHVLLIHGDKIVDNDKIYPFFMVIGIAVAYFDFLTYPIAAFGIPAALAMLLSKGRVKEKMMKLVWVGISWGIGYVGMWCGKWLIGSLVLDINIIAEAIGRASVHSGDATLIDGTELGVFGALWRNIKVLLRWPYFLSVLFICLYYVRKLICNFQVRKLKECLPFICLCILPCIWIMLLKSHSSWCYWYTYRNLAVTAFSGVCVLLILSENKNGVCDKNE